MSLVRFNALAGIPLHYDRYLPPSPHVYGTRGKQLFFKAAPRMLGALEACFEQLSSECPMGRPQVITTAGAWVSKGGSHGKGIGFDLDGLHWEGNQWIATSYPQSPSFYLGIESVLRQHFGTVLGFNYDRRHEDHFHIDLGTAVGFNRYSKSRTEYVQACLLHLHGYQIDIDGRYGPDTTATVKEALADLQISGGLSSKENWHQFLRTNAKLGLGACLIAAPEQLPRSA
ncbi:extensin family protein [Ferrimonas marina]|uniref:Extensin-like protein C-terminus n=1 Tax=Ferrimonas marina TaxID=299255 RepID=A0A1M5UET6_9GAMM|nr:extensin family protein [Ferrimonas marina]SHH61544.1 Extensin-like protein C-terminus [Ferrimonas marina]